jgi:hypothetical protein
MGTRAIGPSEDFDRITALPWRVWSDPQLEALALALTKEYKTHFGAMTFKPIQAFMLADFAQVDGLFAMVGVGKGKTLASMMLPRMGEYKRPLLLVPANVREKTYYDMRDLSRHFGIHPKIRVMTYEQLSGLDADAMLEEAAPDIIIADEAHKIKDRTTARTRKFERYMQSRHAAGDRARFCALSGSQFRRSVAEMHHLMGFALPDDNAPIPYVRHVIEDWGQALDPHTIAGLRPRPGVILDLAKGDPRPPDADTKQVPAIDQARRCFRRRLTGTWGVVATSANALETSLILRARPLDLPKVVADGLQHLRDTWQTLNDDELEQAVDVWRHARELACGFAYRWDPPPEKEWLGARKAWHKHVREVLKLGQRGLDSPQQVALAYPHDERLAAWRNIRDSYRPEDNKVAIWYDDFMVRDAVAWLKKEGPGIVWVEHKAVGYAIAEATGLRYFGGGEAANKDILTLTGKQSIIASIKAHGTGANLQMFSRALITSCAPSSDTWEQLLGRLQREGQKADEVIFDLYLHVPEILEGLAGTFEEARFVEQSSGQSQCLLYSDKLFSADVKKALASTAGRAGRFPKK